ncbi:hypothetical protein V6N11_052350 [Hibiscus sabdariffa]
MSRTIHDTAIVEKHEQCMVDYGRKYESESEKEKRYNIFKENLEYIENFNNVGNRTFKLDCCWAFAAVAALESLTQIQTGKLISMSEKQLLDCSTTGGNQGCNGGLMVNAYQYIFLNKGITSEESYPYVDTQQACDTGKQTQKVASPSVATRLCLQTTRTRWLKPSRINPSPSESMGVDGHFVTCQIMLTMFVEESLPEYLVPQEYVTTMRESMLNKCSVSSYEQVCEVFKKELGETPDKVFDEFDLEPIASASLAKVHVARMHDGHKVVVQHTHMTDTAAADQATMEFLVNTGYPIF